jgi:hypothetical protein
MILIQFVRTVLKFNHKEAEVDGIKKELRVESIEATKKIKQLNGLIKKGVTYKIAQAIGEIKNGN